MPVCVKCGKGLNAGARFCVACGTPVTAPSAPAPPPPRAASPQAATAAKPAAAPSAAQSSAAPSKASTASLLPEFWRYVRKRLPAMLITFLGGVVVHLYLTYLNNGFDPGKVSEWTPYINVSENPGSSAFLIWTAVSSLGWSFLFTIFKEGPVRAATSIAMQPVNLVKKLFKSSVLEYACWAVGGGGALLAAATLGSNRPAGISMGLVWVFMGMSRAGQMLAQFIFQGLMHVLSGHLGRLRPSAELIQIVLAGLGPGFMIAGLLNSGDWQALVGLVVLAGGIGLFFAGRKRQGGMAAAAGQLSALLLIAGGAVAVYTLIRMLWPRSVLANDFGEAENGSFWNAVKNGGDAIVTAAKKAVETALGATGGALAPPIKPPQVYGGSTDPGTGETTPQRTNPWDPDPEEQKNRWKKDHVIWDPQTLEYRPPLPDEYPPPDGPPEYHKKTPYETDHPRDQVPPDCLDLYDKYVKAQGTAQNGASDLKSAAEAYQKAQAVYNLKLQMWTLIMGAQMGEIAAGGVAGVRGAGVAAESAGAAGTSAVRQASREGLREIADSAAVEAAAAETEVNNLTAQVTQLRQLSLDATTEASAAGQALETLKASGVAEEQGAADSASTEVQAAEKAEAESEGELDISRKGAANARKDAEAARNRFERVKEAAARNKEFDALQNEKDSIAERYQELDLEQREVEKQADALRDKRVVPIQRQLKEAADAAADKEAADLWMQQNDVKNQIRELEGQQKQLGAEAVPKAQAELAQLDDQIAAIDAQQKQIISRVSPKKTFKAGDLSGADLQEYQQLSQKMDELKSQRLRVGNDPTAASEVSDKASGLQAQIDAAKEQQAKIEARAKEIDSQDYRKGINDRIREDVANQPLPPDEAALRARSQAIDDEIKAGGERSKQLSDRQDQLHSQGLTQFEDSTTPARAEQNMNTAEEDARTLEQHLADKQDEAKRAHETANAARGKLKEANQKLAEAQQNSESKITEQENKVKEANEKVNSLAQKESDASKKLQEAEQNKTEALRRKQDTENAYQQGVQQGDAPSAGGSGTAPDSNWKTAQRGGPDMPAGVAPPVGPGGGQHNLIVDPKTGRTIDVGDNYVGSGRPLVDQQTGQVVTIDKNYDPLHDQREQLRQWADKLDPQGAERAKWTQDKIAKLQQAFGVSSPEEAADVLAKAKAELDSTYQAYQDKMKAYGQACDDLGLVGMGDNWTSLHSVAPGEDFWDKFAQQAKDGLKAKLDQCIDAHTFWKGDSPSGGSGTPQQ